MFDNITPEQNWIIKSKHKNLSKRFLKQNLSSLKVPQMGWRWRKQKEHQHQQGILRKWRLPRSYGCGTNDDLQHLDYLVERWWNGAWLLARGSEESEEDSSDSPTVEKASTHCSIWWGTVHKHASMLYSSIKVWKYSEKMVRWVYTYFFLQLTWYKKEIINTKT